MIKLNLMPKDMIAVDKKKKSSFDFKIPNMPKKPVIIAALSVFILIQFILGFVAFIQKQQLDSVSNKISAISAQKSEAITVKGELDELHNRFTVIQGLTQGSLAWSKKLYDLSKAMIDGIWLDSLSLEAERPRALSQPAHSPHTTKETLGRQTLVLTGFAVSSSRAEETAAVGKFIDSLKRNKDFFHDFDDIKLSSINRESYGNADVMSFTIVCYFKADRSYFEKLSR